MKKRVFTLLLALVMCLFAISAFAAEIPPEDDVHVPATMQVRKTGTDAAWTTSKNSITLSAADMAGTVDFRATLNTTPIKNAITEWYEYGESLIMGIAGTNATLEATLRQHFNEWPVTGEFTVTITYPDQFVIPAEYTADSKTMVGFNDEAKTLFEETGRSVSGNTLTIVIAIKDADNDTVPGITEQTLYDRIIANTYLNELTFTVEGVATGTFTTPLTVVGNMRGTTNFQFGTDPSDDVVRFFTNDRVTATLRKLGDGGNISDKDYKVTFNIDGDTSFVDPMYTSGKVKAEDLPKPEKPGYKFDGWYTDSAMSKPVGDSIIVSSNITLYGHFASETLVTEEHYAYIIGYPDETIRPNNNITREEATMIFYRLLRDEVRDSIFTTENNFSDIAPERWSNSAISTMANGGYIVGRNNGTFDPEAPITRAEFAAMAVRFASLMDTSGATFTDIAGHWGEKYILKASTAGWIKGYPDGTFHPNAYITRAEAMTLVNNVLSRSVNAAGLHANTRKWIDISEGEWYYYIVLEATNSHNYTRQEDGINEIWSEILPNKTWK
ncbi:MAG: S-layer homology domain-containing protein [Clostridia bacterium]|nr:S-layer homology domain-containing protein [Clostridia bacterium]